jgi:hypothetical protein
VPVGGGSTKFGWLAVKFSVDDFEGAQDRCNNSAPGVDGIKFIMFKFLPEEAKRYLLGIFNEIISTGRVPESWLRTMVVPILKPRKDLDLSDSYRPISLRPCARKLLEKMLCTCLDYWAEKHDVLSSGAYDNVMIDILSDILRERGTSAGREIFVPFIVAEEIGFLYCREYMTLVEVRYSAFSSTISLGRVRISSSHLDVNSFIC